MQDIIGQITVEKLRSPTSTAHNFLKKNPNDAKFISKFIVLKRSTTFMLEVFSFEAFLREAPIGLAPPLKNYT